MLANNFEQMVAITKRPIFSYIEIEIVKLLKRFAANPPASSIALINKKEEETVAPKTKEEKLDDLFT